MANNLKIEFRGSEDSEEIDGQVDFVKRVVLTFHQNGGYKEIIPFESLKKIVSLDTAPAKKAYPMAAN